VSRQAVNAFGALLAAAALTALNACDDRRVASATPDRPQRGVHVVVLGDSLGLGTGATNPAGGFAYRIFSRLATGRPHSTIRNFSIGGARAADVERLEVPRLRAIPADVIIVVAGANDVVRHTPAPQFARTYEHLVAGVRRLQPGATIVLCGVPDIAISPLFAGSNVAIAEQSRLDDQIVHRVARRNRAAVIDLYGISRRARGEAGVFLGADRFHPSDVGYERITEAAYPVVAHVVDH